MIESASSAAPELAASFDDARQPRDVRDGRAWTRGQALKNALFYCAIRAALFVLRPLPRSWLVAASRAAGAIAYRVAPGARKIAFDNVACVFPDATDEARRALVRRAYRALGEHLGETLALLLHGDGGHAALPSLTDVTVDPAAVRLLAEARASGAGVVFASAHLGPWESVAATLVAAGVPLTTLARESYDPRLTKLYDRLRGAYGVRAIYRGHAGAAARIIRTLRDGRVLGVPMDLRSRVPSIDVPFLGHLAPTAVGPARIALRTGAAVVVGTAARRADGKLWVTATPIRTSDLEKGVDGERVLTTRINDELSRRILALPDGWVWMHPRWRR